MTIAYDAVPAALQPAFAQVRHLLGVHRRHIAGKPRAVADLMQFHEIADRLEELLLYLRDEPSLAAAVSERLELLKPELEECGMERARSMTMPGRQDDLAARANHQFALYQTLFANRTRLTRRTELAYRIYISLTSILHEMQHLEDEQITDAAMHARNVELVTKEIQRVAEEGSQIMHARKSTSRDELIRQLGADAAVEYIAWKRHVAGEVLTAANVAALGGICDRLGELAFQMLALSRKTDDSINMANLRLASRNLAAFELTYLERSERGKPGTELPAAANAT